MHEIGPFSIPVIRDFVPEKLKPWIVIAIVIVFQLSGGVYLAAVSEMVGSTALMQEDILMAGYASLVGMALTFAIMFRLKFRFPPKTALLTCCMAIILCNLICMNTRSVPLLVFVSFISGFFRMWGTFECNSTVQLWITPKRDLSVFFCYIYLLVQSCLQFCGLLTVYTSSWIKWEYMHWLIIGLLVLVMLVTMVVYHNHRTMPKLPLYGIDWLGAVMWGGILLCIIFVCVYGEHYDWYESEQIRLATVGGIALLLLNLWRASFIRHPFIALETWRFKAVYQTFLLYIVVDILLAPSHLFEHIYMEGVLGYDSLNVISLNWVILFGTVLGSVFTYLTFARRKWCYRTMTVIAFMAITGYLLIFYFTIDYNLPKEMLVFPLFLRSFGYVIIAISFITALSRVPFKNFFEAVSVQAFVSAAFGGALGAAILGHVLNVVIKRNAVLLGATLDHVNLLANQLPVEQLYGAVQQQALMVSMKELYGWLAIISLFCLCLFWLGENSVRPLHALHPRYRMIRRYIKHELRVSMKPR
ncbi:hypothetical protein [Bacteroides salyersiae]|uniref:hypothetical protein n=1 Tax=Bacteroides salyersiae TaxID=291644 RepID=UPI001C8CB91D|nr:hypothetical protein [Bacteroides salyersiae]